jgi:large subunit ribosomal protein L5
MATTEKEQKAAPASAKGGGQKGGGKSKGGKKGEVKERGPHAGANLPNPAPRLKGIYEQQVRARLMQQFGLTNPHQVPTLEKIVINMGVGKATQQPSLLEAAVADLTTIAGQKPIVTKAGKSIAGFKLREGQSIGTKVTLRGDRMWEFLDRLIAIAIPRIRDFRGLPAHSWDGRGNYTFGLNDQTVFTEIDYDKIDSNRGMDITIVTTATTNEAGKALLDAFGFPFRTGADAQVVETKKRNRGQFRGGKPVKRK